MFRVGVTGDFLKADGSLGFGDIGLDLFAGSDVSWDFLPTASEVLPQQARDYDGLLVLAPRVTARTLAGTDRLKVVARFGVGYDNVDVPACTQAGVLLTITPEGVRRPVAVAAIHSHRDGGTREKTVNAIPDFVEPCIIPYRHLC